MELSQAQTAADVIEQQGVDATSDPFAIEPHSPSPPQQHAQQLPDVPEIIHFGFALDPPMRQLVTGLRRCGLSPARVSAANNNAAEVEGGAAAIDWRACTPVGPRAADAFAHHVRADTEAPNSHPNLNRWLPPSSDAEKPAERSTVHEVYQSCRARLSW